MHNRAMIGNKASHKYIDPDRTGGCLPTPQQELLLGAALFVCEDAAAAWQAWRATPATGDIDFDLAGHRLFPLVYENLARNPARHKTFDPGLDTLKTAYRQSLLETQVRLYHCAQVISLLHQAGIPTLALKGVPLAARYYAYPGLRPMSDFDILVPRAAAQAALRAVREAGWRAGANERQLDDDDLDGNFLAVRHSQNLADAQRRQFDLHWHVLPQTMNQGLDEAFWECAEPLHIHDVATRMLCPTDQLLHICVHGAAWERLPPIRWIADAVMILRTQGNNIDWDRLLTLAQTYELHLSLHFTLAYLQRVFLARLPDVTPIPDYVLEQLAQMPASNRTQRLFRARTERAPQWGQFPLLWARYRDYVARHRAALIYGQTNHETQRPMHFLRFVAVYYGYAGLPQVLQWAVDRSVRRVRRIFFGPSA